jgi:hypothetical protein
MEHIWPSDEGWFMRNITQMLSEHGVFIVGMPSLESQVYASDGSKALHCNCKTEQGLRESMQKYFVNVFMFGMQDETLTCSYGPMNHYRLAVCC